MRTLKKTLCLVLALVMMLGVCAFGTSAAFTDEAQITYKEAVAVLNGIGVINGMGNGTFAPKGTLTRAQACTIISKLMGGDGITAKSTFTDMEGYAWAESYVAFCQAKGIVGGYGDGRFGPGDTLTGSQWGRMLLLAAGFDAKTYGFESGNANWEIGVAKTVKDQKLAANIAGFNGTQPISRDAACEMAFKGMQISPNGSAGYTVDGVPGGPFELLEAYILSGNDASKMHLASAADSLKNTNFPGLDSALDASGARPATVWTLNGKEIARIYAAAAYTTTAYVPTADLNKALKTAKVLGESDTEYTDGTNPTANGVKVEWIDKDTVVKTDAKLAAVTSVRSVAANKQHGAYVEYGYKVGSTSKIGKVYSTIVNKDTDVDTVVIEGTVAKGDTVLVVESDDRAVPTLKVAQTVSGTVSGVRGTTITVGGKTYSKSGTAGATLDIAEVIPGTGKTVAFFVDEYGFIMDQVPDAESAGPVYTMILATDDSISITGGKLIHDYTVKAADVDGKVNDYKVSKTEFDSLTSVPTVATVEADAENEGCYDFTAVASNSAAFAATDKQVNGKLVGAGTKFIYVDKNAKGEITGTVTVLSQGSAKGFVTNAAYVLTDAADRVATVVFVTGATTETTGTDQFVYYLGTWERLTQTTYAIDVILKGEETTMTVKALPAGGAGFYASLSTDGTGTKVAAGDIKGNKLENVVGYVYLDNVLKTDMKATDSTPVYVIDVTPGAPVSRGENTTFGALVSAGAIGDANDEIYAAMNGENVLAFYILQNTNDVG